MFLAGVASVPCLGPVFAQLQVRGAAAVHMCDPDPAGPRAEMAQSLLQLQGMCLAPAITCQLGHVGVCETPGSQAGGQRLGDRCGVKLAARCSSS